MPFCKKGITAAGRPCNGLSSCALSLLRVIPFHEKGITPLRSVVATSLGTRECCGERPAETILKVGMEVAVAFPDYQKR